MSMFKAYDVRGIFPSEITPGFAEKLGFAFAVFLDQHKYPLKILVGRDIRNGSDVLMDAFAAGAARIAEVHTVGICTTPALNILTASEKYSAGVMVTASHNPKEYNGFKFCLKHGKPLGYATGLERVEEIFNSISELPNTHKKITSVNILEKYFDILYKFFRLEEISKKHVVIDSGNGVAAVTALPIFRKLDIPYTAINLSLDGNFPDRSPDPSNGVDALQKAVKIADVGFAFDGDADRLIVVDEKGSVVSSSAIAQLLAHHYLDIRRYASVVLDLRLSRAVSEYIYEHHGEVILSKTGHVNIKQTMRETNAIMGAELSGHYYHKQIYFIDDAVYTALVLLLVLHRDTRPLSEIVASLQQYPQLHKNLAVANITDAIVKIKNTFSDARIDFLDGIRLSYPEWWAVIRPSNTENLLRISIEGYSEQLIKEKLLSIEKVL